MKLKPLLSSVGLMLALASAALTTRVHGPAANQSEDAKVATITAHVLEGAAYTGHQAPGLVSEEFLDRYLEMLDPNRLYFLDSDLEEFGGLRERLQAITLQSGDTRPAREIFNRFVQRLDQRVEYVQHLLKTNSFDFTGNESYCLDRRTAPRPHDLAEAKAIWRQHLRYEYLQEKLANRKPEEIVTTLTRRYERNLHFTKQLKLSDTLEMYLTALAHAYDPHSDYLGPRQAQDFSIGMNLSLVGIGATLQADDGYCKIRELAPGGPAARCKQLKVGDRIVAVAQDGHEPVDVVDMPLQEVVGLVRGAKGTIVRLAFIPADAADSSVRKTVSLVRDEIKLEDQEAKAQLIEVGGQGANSPRLGIIDLPSFYAGSEEGKQSGPRSASADVARLIEKLKAEHVEGIILDLRRNGGGSLKEAIALTGLFIKRGPVVQTKDADGHVRVESDPDPSVLYDGPLVVLTSRLSASASEILAGALQDYGRALVVGDSSTFGKGTVQSMLPLDVAMRRAGLTVKADPGVLKYTCSKFYRPNGASTQLRGVRSDIVVPSPTQVLKVGEREMPGALPWDCVEPARHAELDRVTPWLSALRESSARRIAGDKQFEWLQEDTNLLKAQLAHPVVSLNENERRREKAANDARAEKRKQDLSRRPAPRDVQYEITLRNVDQPGLPQSTRTAVAKHPTDGPESDLELPELPHASKDGDPTLHETEQILLDYVGLLNSGNSRNVAQPVVRAPFEQVPKTSANDKPSKSIRSGWCHTTATLWPG